MSVTNFGLTTKKVTALQEKALDRLARKAGANCWYRANVPGNGLTGWGEMDNRGYPFDTNVSDRFFALVDEACLGHLFE